MKYSIPSNKYLFNEEVKSVECSTVIYLSVFSVKTDLCDDVHKHIANVLKSCSINF